MVVKSTQNQYFMGSRLFDVRYENADISGSISKIISAKKSEELVQKLYRLTNTHQAEQLQKFAAHPAASNRIIIYYIIGEQRAIGNHQQILFKCMNNTRKKENLEA